MTQPAEPLLDRWLADAELLATRAGRDLWLAEGSMLLGHWSQEHRRYHTPQHLAEVLRALDELTGAGHLDARQALLARAVGWYHDVHYDPAARPGSNEQRSAMMARDHLHRMGVEDWAVDAVEAGVLMTADHDADGPGRVAEQQVLDAAHDADLWILSAPADRYAAYRTQVREEYAHVPDDAFRAGRAQIIGAFAERERIYRTAHAHEGWTARARANLAAELADL
ncbi:HD domain-containing protein [Ornithinimicrobium avium]|uniref:Metal-dependent phosphohydrolase n=1 Tax=Ornithinimicrobium avium TaxID=2283195 RepID=A0A345NQX8_9MICO|nr:metal-dependent phosphohydrolase [Ornithinimicrobium avium]AXH97436.1 metal-dependent phosphohydrolase [Ornithinimicrobium avium]